MRTKPPSKDIEPRKASAQSKESPGAAKPVRLPRLGGTLPSGEEPFRTLVEQIPAVSYISECGVKGRVRYVSPQIESLLGYTPKEWVANIHLWAQRLHPEDAASAVAEENNTQLHPGPYRFEYRLLARNDREVWVRDEGVVLTGAGYPEPLQHGILTDITEVKEAERLHRAADERMRLALEGLGMGCWELDPEKGLISWDENLYKALQVSSTTFSRKFSDFLAMVHPEDRPGILEELERSKTNRRPYSMEYRVIFPDGKVQWRASFARPLFDTQGKLLRYVGVNQDITERKQAEEALRRSQDQLKMAMEAARMGSWYWNATTGIITWDDNLYRMNGLTRETFHGTAEESYAQIHPEDRPRIIEATQRAIETHEPLRLTFRVVLPDGTAQWREMNTKAFYNPAGSLLGAVGITQDITERKQAEEALRVSEGRLRTAMQAASMGAWEWDAATNHTTWDENFKNLVGEGPVEAASSPEGVLGYMVPEDRPRFLEAVKRCSVTGERYELEFRIHRPDGEIRWISDQGRATLDESGRVVRFQGVAQDVTERRKAERALRESEERLHLALETAELGMWEWLPGADSFYLDDRECRLLGVTPATAPKTSLEFIQLVHSDDREIVVEAVKRAFRTGESSAGEVRVRMPDGNYRWLTSTGRIVRDALGNIEIVRGITLDITHRRKLEEQLRLAQKMEAIGQLAGGVAHDFNNLLTVIRGHTELILDGAAGNQQLQHNAMAVQEAARRAASITQQLLAFSRRQVLQPHVLDLNQVVTKSAELLRRLIPANIELHIDTATEPLWIKADASQLEQVLMNLVVNARDAMPAGGKLQLTTRSVPADSPAIRRQIGMPEVNYVLLTVRDTGVGMDADTQDHIFDPFFTTKEPGKGTGLGLATVYGVVKQSSGWVFVESELGKGSAFLLFFPETAAGSDREATKSARPGKSTGNETILVAEDQEDVRALAVAYLTSLGYTVLAAENGESALDLAERQSGQIHLLLTDAMMPRMSGLALARRLRERRPGIKVLYISGYANDAAALEGIGLENEPFLQKPFAMDELARKVRGLLD